MKAVKLRVTVSPEARDAAVRRAILGDGQGQVRLTFGQRRALDRLNRLLSRSPMFHAESSS